MQLALIAEEKIAPEAPPPLLGPGRPATRRWRAPVQALTAGGAAGTAGAMVKRDDTSSTCACVCGRSTRAATQPAGARSDQLTS